MNREWALKVALVLVGLLFLAGICPAADSLWHANANQSDYGDEMIRCLASTSPSGFSCF